MALLTNGLEVFEEGSATAIQILDANFELLDQELGRLKRPVNTVTGAAPAIPSTQRYYVLVNATSNNVAATLPTAVGLAGLTLVFKRIDASGFTATVAPGTGGQTVEGVASISLASQETAILFSDGTNWRRVLPMSATAIGAIPVGEKGAANGVATLDSGGKIPVAQLPGLALTDIFVVSDQTEMLALAADTGDLAIRTDEAKTYALRGTDPTELSDWEEIQTPTGTIVSVFGRTGAVVAQSGDYSADEITDLDEFVEDQVAGMIQPGSVVATYDDGAGALVFDVDIIGQTEEEAPASDASVLVQETGGNLRKVALSNLPAGSTPDLADVGGVVLDTPADGELAAFDESGNLVNATLAALGIAAVADVIPVAEKGVADGVATLDGDALIPAAQLPPEAISNTHEVADVTAMLALVATVGDVAVVAADGTVYKLKTADATQFSSWVLISTPQLLGSEIATLYEAEDDRNAYTDAEKSKLAGIEALADVTDPANVSAAGAVMHSEIAGGEGFVHRASGGALSAIKSNLTATTDPGATDDVSEGYGVGSLWINVTGERVFQLVDPTEGAAVWRNLTAGVDGLTEGSMLFGSSAGGVDEAPGELDYDAAEQRISMTSDDAPARIRMTAENLTASKLAHSPGGEVSSAALGGVAWTNLHRMRVEDSSGVGASPIYAGSNSQWLLTGPIKLRDAGVPVGATINGFQWRVRRLQTNVNGVVKIRDLNVSMFLNGSSSGDNKADTVTDWPTSYADKLYGGASDVWGLTGLDDEDEVQLAVLAQGVGGVLGTAEVADIDYIELEVFYSYTQTFEIENSAADGRTKLLANGVEVASVWPNGTVSVVPRFSGARVYRTTNQSIGSGAFAAVQFEAVRWDRGGLFDPATPTRLTAPFDAFYSIRGQVAFDNGTAGRRWVALRVDGATLIDQNYDAPADSADHFRSASTVWFLRAGQYVELLARQDSGGNLNMVNLDAYANEFTMHAVGVQ